VNRNEMLVSGSATAARCCSCLYKVFTLQSPSCKAIPHRTQLSNYTWSTLSRAEFTLDVMAAEARNRRGVKQLYVGNVISIRNPENTTQTDAIKDNDLIFQGSCQGLCFRTIEDRLNIKYGIA